VDVELTRIEPDDLPELHRTVAAAFGEVPTPEAIEDERLTVEYDRMIGVRDSGRSVAGAGAYSFELTLPGATRIPVAGVTWVGCLPSHRRRGILTRIMAHQLDDIAARREAVAILTASEAVIYGRFGYGLSTQAVWAKVPVARAAFVEPPRAGGRMRLVWGEEREKILPPLFDAWRRERPGSIHRSEGRWQFAFRDRERHRDGASALFTAVHEDDAGTADGYVSYRVREGKHDGANTTVAQEVIARDPSVEAALWRYLLDIDLCESLDVQVQPVDALLPWLLTDHRAYRVVHVNDFLWTRIVDVPAALTARRYATEGTLVLEVHDPFRPAGAAQGQFRLEGSPDGATCRPVGATADPDLRLDVSALGSLYLGGVRASVLAAAGRLDAAPEAARRADLLFGSEPLPYCNTGF